jgi:hypothetical protein
LLAAQNRLGKEMVAQLINLLVITAACFVGLEWGLEGVAWGIVLSQVLLSIHFYWLVHDAMRTRMRDLLYSISPGLSLSAMLFGVLALVDYVLGEYTTSKPLAYTFVMSTIGGFSYAAGFMFLPIAALQTETMRWRKTMLGGVGLIKNAIK